MAEERSEPTVACVSNSRTGGKDMDVVINRVKLVLEEHVSSTEAQLCGALKELQALNEIPVEVFKATQIGKLVKTCSKHSSYDSVRKASWDLVTTWKDQLGLKRRAEHQDAPESHKRHCCHLDVAADPNVAPSTTTPMDARDVTTEFEQRFAKSVPLTAREFLKRCAAVGLSAQSSQENRSQAANCTPHIMSADSIDVTVSSKGGDRRKALKAGGESALLDEVVSYLKSHGSKASLNELNIHIHRLWQGPNVVIDCSKFGKTGAPKGPDDPPVVGKRFVERHQDKLKLEEKFKPTKGSRKGMTAGYHVGTHVRLLRA
eukprot:TRINITY_DN30343_c0_g1_i1.p1 TRINITY_DN30343_c0_g1~~TRINITY_DN30343_c0_g1_i1.p1  ORF type:complete len:317 (-),score=34.49 TRINITY_DN30343_c0_g1_i1:166-1116(-)